MSSIWEHFPKGGSDLLVMLALADWGDDSGGRIYPSMSAIAKKIRCDRRHAQRIVHKLIDTGYLFSEGNDKGGNPGDTRHYRINLERLTGDIQTTGGADVTGDTQTTPGVTSRTRTGGPHVTLTVIKQPLSSSTPVGSLPADRLPDCPHQEIIKLYEQHLPMLTQPRKWTGNRATLLKARWIECSKANGIGKGYSTLQDGLAFWNTFFAHVAQNTKLPAGLSPTSDWRPDLEWLVKDENFTKTIEGKYDR